MSRNTPAAAPCPDPGVHHRRTPMRPYRPPPSPEIVREVLGRLSGPGGWVRVKTLAERLVAEADCSRTGAYRGIRAALDAGVIAVDPTRNLVGAMNGVEHAALAASHGMVAEDMA